MAFRSRVLAALMLTLLAPEAMIGERVLDVDWKVELCWEEKNRERKITFCARCPLPCEQFVFFICLHRSDTRAAFYFGSCDVVQLHLSSTILNRVSHSSSPTCCMVYSSRLSGKKRERSPKGELIMDSWTA